MLSGLSSWCCYWITFYIGSYIVADNTDLNIVNIDPDFTSVILYNIAYTGLFSCISSLTFPILFSTTIINRWLLSYFFMDFMFYILHRLFHISYLYPFHKKHHRVKSNLPIAAMYCSPLEAILVDTLPTSIGPLIFGMKMTEMCIWFSCMAMHSLILHSNWKFGFVNPNHHIIHHQKITKNFGMTYIFDYIFNTQY